MEKQNNEIILKKRKLKGLKKIKNLFQDKKKRHIYLLLFVSPFILAIAIFGFVAFKEAKNLLALAKGDTSSEVNAKHIISSQNYVLRDNATDLQEECFAELKNAIESGAADGTRIAELVCKNFVADFFTWSNKTSQYDVGGLYYVYNGEQQETGKYKLLLYTEMRDSFYKYLSTYINQYGAENLLEVESITVNSSEKSLVNYEMWEKTGYELVEYDEETGDSRYDKVFDCVDFDTYLISLSWTYKPNEVFNTAKYPTKMNFAVVYREGRYEIVEMQEGKINVEEHTY